VAVPYTHKNIISAVSSQVTALPPREQFRPGDIFVPANTLADQFTRILTYALMVSGSTIALNAVTPPSGKLESSCALVKPTIIIVSADELSSVHRFGMAAQVELFHTFVHWFQMRKLVPGGRVPAQGFFARFNDYDRPNLGPNLRLIYAIENPSEATKPLSLAMLNNLRAIMFSKIIYAFTYPAAAAGAITQQNIHDYRPSEEGAGKLDTHFGSPLSCLEIKTVDAGKFKVDSEEGSMGEIVISGPAVIGGEQNTGIIGRWRTDGCLALGEKSKAT